MNSTGHLIGVLRFAPASPCSRWPKIKAILRPYNGLPESQFEDVASDAFDKAFPNWDRATGKSWPFYSQILNREALQCIRKSKANMRRPERVERELNLEGRKPGPEVLALLRESRETIDRALLMLGEEDRKIILKKYGEGLTPTTPLVRKA